MTRRRPAPADDAPDGAPEGAADGAERAARPRRLDWVALVIGGLFGLLFAYQLFEGLANLIGLPVFYDQLNIDGAAIPWAVLVAGVLVPPAVFVGATALGLRRTLPQKVVLWIAGLAVSAALALSFIAMAARALAG